MPRISDPQALPAEIARREALKAKLDAACARLEAEARAEADAERRQYEAKKAAYEAKKGRRGRPPKPPDETPPPDRQSNLTDPDSQLMRSSKAHEYRQAYNAQAVVCAEGRQLILATNMATTPSDQPSFAATILAMETDHRPAEDGPGRCRLCQRRGGGRTGGPQHRAAGGDRPHPAAPALRLPPAARAQAARRITEPWRLAMKAKLETEDGKARYKKRKQTVEPVFGIIKSAMGFTRFHLRGLLKVAAEWLLVALAYNCRRLHRLRQA